MSAVACRRVKAPFNCNRYVARGMIACVCSAPGSGADTSALQEPSDAPRRELIIRYRAANIRMRGEDHSSGRTADDGCGLRCQVCEEVQERPIPQAPIHREG